MIYWNLRDINKEFEITDTEPKLSTLLEIFITHDPWIILVKISWFIKLMEKQSLDVQPQNRKDFRTINRDHKTQIWSERETAR